jgi:AbiV family abortive infection protein
VSKQAGWKKVVTPQLKRNIEESAQAAYLNGCSLHEDAMCLFAAERYSRAAALAILAEEEFSKAFVLRICADQNRWDSNIYIALRKHSTKQGISEAMRDHFDWFNENYRRVMEINRYSLAQSQPATIPNKEKMTEIINKAKSRFAKPIRDYLKQNAFYVSVDKDAKPKSIPSSIGKKDAQQCLDESEKFKFVVEMLGGDTSGAAKWTPR